MRTEVVWQWYVVRAETYRNHSMLLVPEPLPDDHLSGLRVAHDGCASLVGFSNTDVPEAFRVAQMRRHELSSLEPLSVWPEISFRCGRKGLISNGEWVDT